MSRPEESSPPPISKDTTTSSSSEPAAPQAGQSASPTLTDKPGSTSSPRSDMPPSGLATGRLDSSRTKSKDPSFDLPPPQTSAPGNSTSSSDAPDSTEGRVSEKRHFNKGDPIGTTSDSKARLKGIQDSGPVSTSQETSHPGAGAKPASAALVADPPGKDPKEGKQGESNPLNESAPKSKDAEDPGTGQRYVKTSGVAAEGGDFDAAKPGAGAEATRLLHKDEKSTSQDGNKSTDQKQTTSSDDGRGKHGIAAKLKVALHKV